MKVVIPGLIVIGFGGLGIIVAAILQSLYNRGVFVDEMITGTITIADLMIMVITLFTLVGIIVAVMKR